MGFKGVLTGLQSSMFARSRMLSRLKSCCREPGPRREAKLHSVNAAFGSYAASPF